MFVYANNCLYESFAEMFAEIYQSKNKNIKFINVALCRHIKNRPLKGFGQDFTVFQRVISAKNVAWNHLLVGVMFNYSGSLDHPWSLV